MMASYQFALVACCFLSIAAAGFPKATTIFSDVTKPSSLYRSSVLVTRTFRFEKAFDLEGVYIGSRHSDDVWGEPPSEDPQYMENLTVYVREHNGTYLAPHKEVGIGRFEGLMEYNSTIYVPLQSLREGEDVLRVRPLSDEHTLYYLAIDHRVPVPGWYPVYTGIDVEYFGALNNFGETENGGIIGIEYSKPQDLE